MNNLDSCPPYISEFSNWQVNFKTKRIFNKARQKEYPMIINHDTKKIGTDYPEGVYWESDSYIYEQYSNWIADNILLGTESN